MHIIEKIEPINRLLESRFGIRVEMGEFDDLVNVREHYDGRRDLLLRTLGETAAMRTDEYAKAVLISEAVRILLREIAPKRLRRKRRP